jgi:uridine phosphorylase
MPARLRPTAPIAADAVLVGDPGRALMLAQVLLEEPKMSNHARGLWGYTGMTTGGRQLSIQSTGMGGPSAALVLADLAELGVRRTIRVGTCSGLSPSLAGGQLLVVSEAHAWSGGGSGAPAYPDPDLSSRLRKELGPEAVAAVVASLDTLHGGEETPATAGDAADMQTATLFVRGRELGVATAALLVVSETGVGRLDDGPLEAAAKRGGLAAAAALST